MLVGLGRPVGGPPAARRRQDCRRVVVPSGCRAFPKDVALVVVALEVASRLLSGCGDDNNLNVGRQSESANEVGAGNVNKDSVVVIG